MTLKFLGSFFDILAVIFYKIIYERMDLGLWDCRRDIMKGRTLFWEGIAITPLITILFEILMLIFLTTSEIFKIEKYFYKSVMAHARTKKVNFEFFKRAQLLTS